MNETRQGLLSEALLRPLEALLNRQIGTSARARELCGQMRGRIVQVSVRETPLQIYVEPLRHGLLLRWQSNRTPEVKVSGSLVGLASMARPDDQAAAQAGHIKIEGDAALAQSFSELLEHARPDWEEELARLIGDVAAHQIGRAVKDFFGWGRNAARTLARNSAEFLQEESRDLPARAEFESFAEDVQQLRRELRQSEQRLRRLEERKPAADAPDPADSP